jgi:hypothetical protein
MIIKDNPIWTFYIGKDGGNTMKLDNVKRNIGVIGWIMAIMLMSIGVLDEFIRQKTVSPFGVIFLLAFAMSCVSFVIGKLTVEDARARIAMLIIGFVLGFLLVSLHR